MSLPWLLAAVHIVALGIGMGAIFSRARALRRLPDPQALKDAFLADSFWGVAAILWLSTGLLRAFGGYEKGSDYYLASPLFHAKMGVFVLILVLEAWPMTALMRWRISIMKRGEVDATRAPLFAKISYVEGTLLFVMVVLATGMARIAP